LPNPDVCDSDAFASCLVESGQGYDVMNGNFPYDIFQNDCAVTNQCTIMFDTDPTGE